MNQVDRNKYYSPYKVILVSINGWPKLLYATINFSNKSVTEMSYWGLIEVDSCAHIRNLAQPHGIWIIQSVGLVIIIIRVVIIINGDYFRLIYATLLMKRHYIIIQILHWTPLPVTVSLWSCSWPRTCRSRSGTAVGLDHKKLLGTSWVISWTSLEYVNKRNCQWLEDRGRWSFVLTCRRHFDSLLGCVGHCSQSTPTYW